MLSGGERARLCLAGLLLSEHNVLILDEPGNHLDVDTVEALAEALLEYEGTVIFTSHDRHFTKKVATCIVEVRDGRVTITAASTTPMCTGSTRRSRPANGSWPPPHEGAARPRQVRQSLAAPAQGTNVRFARKSRRWNKRSPSSTNRNARSQARSLESTDAAEALRLHNELAALTAQLTEAEERWCSLQEEVEILHLSEET